MPMGRVLYRHSNSRSSDLDHFKVDLGRITIGALPRIGDIFPARTWIKPVFWQTFSFIVNEAADDTHPRLIVHMGFLSWGPKHGILTESFLLSALKSGAIVSDTIRVFNTGVSE